MGREGSMQSRKSLDWISPCFMCYSMSAENRFFLDVSAMQTVASQGDAPGSSRYVTDLCHRNHHQRHAAAAIICTQLNAIRDYLCQYCAQAYES